MPCSRRRRIAGALLGLGALGVLATGCGGDAAAVSASMESAPRPAAPELPEDPSGGVPPELTIPDLSIPEDLPDSDQMQECATLAEAYAKVVVLALSGDDGGELPALFDQLEAAAPAEVQDDLAVVERTVTEAADSGLLGATGALLDQEYVDANAAILDWLTATCSVEGA